MSDNKQIILQHTAKDAGKVLSAEEMKQIFGGIGGLGTKKHAAPPKRPNLFLPAKHWAGNN